MLRVGVTGGIGSGKSTVSRRFAELGAFVIDADALAREVVQPGTAGLAAVVSRFGSDVLLADGSLDRAKLASIVFDDKAALADLNAIVHPLVGARGEALVAEAVAQGVEVVVHEIPLLVETGAKGRFDVIIVVETPMTLRLTRLADRGMTEQDAKARIKAQGTDAERRALADLVLINDGTLEQLHVKIDQAWARLDELAKNRVAGLGGPERIG